MVSCIGQQLRKNLIAGRLLESKPHYNNPISYQPTKQSQSFNSQTQPTLEPVWHDREGQMVVVSVLRRSCQLKPRCQNCPDSPKINRQEEDISVR